MSKFHTTDFDFLPEHAFRRAVGRSSPATLEGGKGGGGGGAPPPDPRLIQAQIDSLGFQNDAIRRVMDQADEFVPLQKEQLRLGLKTAQTAYDQSQEDRTYALGRRDQLDRVQEPLLDEARNFNEPARRGQMMQEANADVSSAFATTRGAQGRALTRLGVNPNSGRYGAFVNQSNIGEALARAEAGRKVSEAAKAEGLNLRTNAVNMLSGYPAMASGLSGTGFSFGTSGIGLANQGAAGANAGFSTAGTMAGQMGANAGSTYGAQLNARTQSQIASNNNTAGMFGSVAGGAATIAAAFI